MPTVRLLVGRCLVLVQNSRLRRLCIQLVMLFTRVLPLGNLCGGPLVRPVWLPSSLCRHISIISRDYQTGSFCLMGCLLVLIKTDRLLRMWCGCVVTQAAGLSFRTVPVNVFRIVRQLRDDRFLRSRIRYFSLTVPVRAPCIGGADIQMVVFNRVKTARLILCLSGMTQRILFRRFRGRHGLMMTIMLHLLL